MLKIYKNLKFIVIAAIIASIPTITLAGPYGGYTYDGDSSGWNYGSGSYSTPSYYDSGSNSDWNYGTGSYSNPSYYNAGSSNSYYPSSNYYGSNTGGGSYNPGYSYTGGSSYPIYSYSSSAVPSTSNSTSNSTANPKTNTSSTATNNTRVTTNSNSSAVASSTNINNNINNNNVYVYTNPQGTAVLQNPAFQRLDGYCLITPNNPRVGQTITVTAYATGGIGSYTYNWGGDIYYGSGASTQFTSQTAGTKNISVTVRSGEEVVTRNCSVTFTNDTYSSYTNYPSYTSSNVQVNRPTSGTPVSGVFVQSGTPVSGVYLNQLPATGIDLGWMDYMIGFLALVLTTVVVAITRSRKQLLATYK